MRRKWMPFALAAIIAASAAITPVYADDPPSGSLPSSFEATGPPAPTPPEAFISC